MRMHTCSVGRRRHHAKQRETSPSTETDRLPWHDPFWLHACPQQTQQWSACNFTSSQMFRSGCVTRTIGLRTLLGLVAAAQLFSWRASPPGFESSTSTGPSSQGHTKGTFAPLNLTLHQDEWGFQWSTLCTWCANSNHGQPPNHAARH